MWNKGHTVDFDAYIQFCLANPGTSYFVNLDVIPGKPNEKRTITPSMIEESALQGWKNYRRMLREGVPKSKLIPVFHQHEKVKWLLKYLEFGTPYIGISPANDMGTNEKKDWMLSLRRHLFDGAGRPVIKTHGFAVTSYRLMELWHWHSVDSKSWKDCASWGGIYYPKTRGSDWDFTKEPNQIQTSPVKLCAHRRGQNIQAIPPNGDVMKRIRRWLDECGIALGEYVTRKETQGYKLDDDEFWFDKKNATVLETKVKGVITHFEERCKVNVHFIKKANKAIETVDHMYFAGAPVPESYDLEEKMGRRLFAFPDVGTGKEDRGGRRAFLSHLSLLK